MVTSISINATELTCYIEAAFLIQSRIATRTITDYCRLCDQARDGQGFLDSERAQMGGYNALLAGLTMETDPQFGDTLKLLEDAKGTCLSTIHPNERCHEKMQNTYNILNNYTIRC